MASDLETAFNEIYNAAIELGASPEIAEELTLIAGKVILENPRVQDNNSSGQASTKDKPETDTGK